MRQTANTQVSHGVHIKCSCTEVALTGERTVFTDGCFDSVVSNAPTGCLNLQLRLEHLAQVGSGVGRDVIHLDCLVSRADEGRVDFVGEVERLDDRLTGIRHGDVIGHVIAILDGGKAG